MKPEISSARLMGRLNALGEIGALDGGGVCRLTVKRMPSGAGHDAQMFAPNCPKTMIFIPPQNGLSHNINEFCTEADIEAGAQVLLDVVCDLAEVQE